MVTAPELVRQRSGRFDGMDHPRPSARTNDEDSARHHHRRRAASRGPKATLSAVINDSAAVKGSTRDRVLAAIDVLNYRPTQVTHASTRKTRSIGLLIKEIDNPYYAEVVLGARAHANEQGYTLLVASSEGEYD